MTKALGGGPLLRVLGLEAVDVYGLESELGAERVQDSAAAVQSPSRPDIGPVLTRRRRGPRQSGVIS